MPEEEFILPDMSNALGKARATFLDMLEVYVDDFIQLVQALDPEKLRHLSRVLLYGIYSVFLPPAISGHNREEPISIKKRKEGERTWEVRNEILGLVMDGTTRCTELAKKTEDNPGGVKNNTPH